MQSANILKCLVELDAVYPTLQKKVNELMQAKGFTEKNWLTKYFPGQDHSEDSWRSQFGTDLDSGI